MFFKKKLDNEYYLTDFLLKNTYTYQELELFPNRKLEQFTWRAALVELQLKLGETPCIVSKNDIGAPYLSDKNSEVSVSHSGDWVLVALNKNQKIGVDIQKITTKIELIKHKFLTEKELEQFSGDSATLTKLWTIKEAVYKLMQIKGLFLKDIELQKFENQIIVCCNSRNIYVYSSTFEQHYFYSIACFTQSE